MATNSQTNSYIHLSTKFCALKPYKYIGVASEIPEEALYARPAEAVRAA